MRFHTFGTQAVAIAVMVSCDAYAQEVPTSNDQGLSCPSVIVGFDPGSALIAKRDRNKILQETPYFKRFCFQLTLYGSADSSDNLKDLKALATLRAKNVESLLVKDRFNAKAISLSIETATLPPSKYKNFRTVEIAYLRMPVLPIISAPTEGGASR